MPILQRLTEDERINRSLPEGWRRTLRHPLMQKICFPGRFQPTPKNVFTAIKLTKSWRGADFEQKVFVLALDLLLEKAFGTSVLEPDNYNRLWDHLVSNEEKMEFWPKQIFIWDIYHDAYGFNRMEAGTLHLPELVRKIKLKRKKKRK